MSIVLLVKAETGNDWAGFDEEEGIKGLGVDEATPGLVLCLLSKGKGLFR